MQATAAPVQRKGWGAAPDGGKSQPGLFKRERRIMTTRDDCMTFIMKLRQLSDAIDNFIYLPKGWSNLLRTDVGV